MITRISSVIRPKGSDLIFDHPYNADSVRKTIGFHGLRTRTDRPVRRTAVVPADRFRRYERSALWPELAHLVRDLRRTTWLGAHEGVRRSFSMTTKRAGKASLF
jgi:transposase